ncbi:MAG: proline--tRNA ligase, partial [Acidimicrobiales bacterium]|nr:proline--tRNA ligase [Acidimicrobiales bacterium]
ARAFDISYLDDQGTQQHAWTTSWGTSTRMVGGLIMTHGDDKGLRLPPSVAPHQAVVLLVRDEDGAGEAAARLVAELTDAGVRTHLDDRVQTSFGRRATDWELKGVPVRIEVGPRDLAKGEVVVARRDTDDKAPVAVGAVAAQLPTLLDEIQRSLGDQARRRRDDRTADAGSIEEVLEVAASGFARIPWSALGDDGERRLAEHAVTVRCLVRPDGGVPRAEDEPGLFAICARSY